MLAGCWPGDDGRQAVDPGDNQAPDPVLMTPRQPLATPAYTPRATRTPTTQPDLPSTGGGSHFPAVVMSKGLNLRRGPGAGYDIVRSYVLGTTVSAVGRSSDGAWLLVQTPDERTGWMAANYLQFEWAALDALPIVEH